MVVRVYDVSLFLFGEKNSDIISSKTIFSLKNATNLFLKIDKIFII
jgi:hypothetical protein